MSLAESCEAVRRGAGLFELPERAVLEVAGEDRTRWLDGMITNDVAALEAAGPGSGCRALLLTHQGRIVADLRVLCVDSAYLLELPRSGVAQLLEHLNRYIIADDVTLRDPEPPVARLALEGPAAWELLKAATGSADEVGEGNFSALEFAGVRLRAARFSLTGLPAAQLFVPSSQAPAVREALLEGGASHGLVAADAETLECLRIEGGQPLLGRELDASVLPAEVRLDEAVSETKGCYTGQEVVARMRSRGRVNHLLVGLRLERADGADAAAEGGRQELTHEGRRIGELTSRVESPAHGPIGLGFVKADLAVAGTRLDLGDGSAVVAPLPFTT